MIFVLNLEFKFPEFSYSQMLKILFSPFSVDGRTSSKSQSKSSSILSLLSYFIKKLNDDSNYMSINFIILDARVLGSFI